LEPSTPELAFPPPHNDVWPARPKYQDRRWRHVLLLLLL